MTAGEKMQQLTILGATGSIGVSTLDVVAQHPDQYQVFALTGHTQSAVLAAQCVQFNPRYAVMTGESAAAKLAALLQGKGLRTEVLVGVEALAMVASHGDVDVVMAAIVGAAGLAPALAAAEAGKRLLLANKESLVVAGQLFMDAVAQNSCVLLPIDSEHNAIFQSLPAGFRRGALQNSGVDKILLTASGGPFRTWDKSRLAAVTVEQACAHPNWSMGRKISVDSATLMNKGLELIEACWLFGVEPEQVDVVVHPQSVIHSMVQYVDGSVIAQMGNPDMRTPIAYGLAWPERISSGVSPLDLVATARLDFESPDIERFPCLRLAAEAYSRGGSSPCVLNAANEVAVAAFLEGDLGFDQIPEVIERVLNQLPDTGAESLQVLLAADVRARDLALSMLPLVS
ncbi:1-deoxy-D-xylulose 5-phosphate reductoisomerase [Sinobacterium norvegicum]|uniref:1-deoxy-D-xylulose 5-phosphate reductoisomerase n=1 Tax=Sinobacterium norvegicum TaxID=1641715 RepID=A0ABM9ACN0_9GAMM|nr:1-deoxy-D-xylulose-5-phosphate reductoisomerase [Sinobacterium norvegicum]CAH0990707.1 1-deoxy-D-xylulose 5-phosphate reductoisomerase [Sinobacterium norvegicum]